MTEATPGLGEVVKPPEDPGRFDIWDPANISPLVAGFGHNTRSLVSVTVGAHSLVKSVERGDGFAGKMLRDQQLYDQLLKAVTDLNSVLADVKRDPKKYTRGLVRVF